MTITIPGYQKILPNQVYSQPTLVTDTDGEVVKLEKILVLTRYQQPSEQDVVDYLVNKANKVSGLTGIDGKHLNTDLIVGLISRFPAQVQVDFRTKNEGLMQFLRDHTAAPRLGEDQERATYLSVDYGVLPRQIIDDNVGSFQDLAGYEKSLIHPQIRGVGLGRKWKADLLYNKEGLPNRSELEVLLKHGVHESRTFSMSVTSYNLDDVKKVLDAVYEGVPRDKIDSVTDVSDQKVAALAERPLLTLAQALTKKEN